jgi:hypothetical protein
MMDKHTKSIILFFLKKKAEKQKSRKNNPKGRPDLAAKDGQQHRN